MSFDPDRTTVLPPVGYPITEEIPAVPPRGGGGRGSSGPSGPLFLKLVGGLLGVGLVAIATLLVYNSRRPNNGASTAPNVVENPTPVFAPSVNPAPTVTELEDGNPGFWQVVGVPDGLNIRSGPGVDNDIVGSLSVGDRHVFGTGERATVNGATWTQITFGANDVTGWVSSQFLATDTPPDPSAPEPTVTPATGQSTSIVCFRSQRAPSGTARLQFTNRTQISGLIRTIDGQTVIDQNVAGTLANGQAQVTLTNVASNEVIRQNWVFSPASVDLGTGTMLSVVNCSTVAGQLP